ncbi:MAG TPA: RDD family protein [Thermoanaerobaculia bacterium]|jgi:uncharacterized RDD family membrane protein YckC|nr:RDD family protein [Thermoanaerobaculia bacterium]
MFCPYCGVSNERWEAKCFVCERSLPSLDAPAAASPARARAAARRETSQPTIASVGDRLIALLFDRIVVVAILLVGGAWAADRWSGYRFQPTLWSAAALGGVIFVVAFLYHFLSEVALLTTLGKAAMGLHVGVEEDRNRLAAIAIRNALRIVDAIGFYLIGFLFATFTSRRQRVGDLVGGTVVLDWPVPRGGRAAMMVLIVIIAVAAVWLASSICPTCGGQAIPSVLRH